MPAAVFGEFTDALGDPTKMDIVKAASSIGLKFTYLGIAAAVGSYLEVRRGRMPPVPYVICILRCMVGG